MNFVYPTDGLDAVTAVACEWATRLAHNQAEAKELKGTREGLKRWILAMPGRRAEDIIIPGAFLSLKTRSGQLSEKKLREFASSRNISLAPFDDLFEDLHQPTAPYLELRHRIETDGIVLPQEVE